MRIHRNVPANFELRIQAFAVEMLSIFFPMLVVIFLVFHPIIEILIVFLPYYFITVFPMFFMPGQSLGKRHAKTKIVNLNNDAPSILRLHSREFFKWIVGFLTLGIYFVVAFIVFTKHPDKRTLHDFLFKTKVVETDVRYTGV